MSNFSKALEREVKAGRTPLGPANFEAGGRQVICLHCKHDQFDQGRAQLNTAGATFFGLDWLNKSASILICQNCGFIQWFGKAPHRMSEE